MSTISFVVPGQGLKVRVTASAHGFKLKEALAMMEKSAIMDVLEETNYNQTQAAKILGMNRTTLVMAIKRHKIATSPIEQWSATQAGGA